MEKPELTLKDLCEEIEEASFSVKMRGYAPEEVDDFMDKLVDRLKAAEEKLHELDRYEQWLREDVHKQVMTRAQEEARQLLQGAQDKSRALLEAAQADIAREQSKLTVGIQQYQSELAAKKQGLEQELQSLQMAVSSYRRQAAQALETALAALQEEGAGQMVPSQTLPRRAAATAPMGGEPVEPIRYTAPTEPLYPTAASAAPTTTQPLAGGSDIDRMLEELRRQIR